MIVPRYDRSRAVDAARRSDARCPNHRSTRWPDVVCRLRLARFAHHHDPQVAVIASPSHIIVPALDRLAHDTEARSPGILYGGQWIDGRPEANAPAMDLMS